MRQGLVVGSASALALLIAGTAYVVLSAPDGFSDCRQGVIAGGAGAIGGDFELLDEAGKTVKSADVVTEPVLLYFGYSFCPDVCPLDNARNVEAMHILADQGMALTPVFVSIDPARDTPEVMKTYTDYVDPKLLGLTGTPEQVDVAARAYRVLYQKASDGEDYLMSHSTMTYLVLPGHGFVEFFRRDETAEAVAKTASCFIKAAPGVPLGEG